MTEVRYRKVNRYINDLASTTIEVPEAVFGFTLDELEEIIGYVPSEDGFHKELQEAIDALRVK